MNSSRVTVRMDESETWMSERDALAVQRRGIGIIPGSTRTHIGLAIPMIGIFDVDAGDLIAAVRGASDPDLYTRASTNKPLEDYRA